MAQAFMVQRNEKEKALRAQYVVPPALLVDVTLGSRFQSFALPPRLSEEHYELDTQWNVTLPVETGLTDTATFPWIDDDQLMKNTFIDCDGAPLEVARVDFDCLSMKGEEGPARGFVVFECDTGTLHLNVQRVDETPSNFLVTSLTWYGPFPVLAPRT
jgi:hypothetical protein